LKRIPLLFFLPSGFEALSFFSPVCVCPVAADRRFWVFTFPFSFPRGFLDFNFLPVVDSVTVELPPFEWTFFLSILTYREAAFLRPPRLWVSEWPFPSSSAIVPPTHVWSSLLFACLDHSDFARRDYERLRDPPRVLQSPLPLHQPLLRILSLSTLYSTNKILNDFLQPTYPLVPLQCPFPPCSPFPLVSLIPLGLFF